MVLGVAVAPIAVYAEIYIASTGVLHTEFLSVDTAVEVHKTGDTLVFCFMVMEFLVYSTDGNIP